MKTGRVACNFSKANSPGIVEDDWRHKENETPLVVISKLWPQIITHVAEK